MHGLAADLGEAETLAAALAGRRVRSRVALFPPATLLDRMARAAQGRGLLVGAQDIYHEPSGAFTGAISAEMAKDVGASLVILGHSERRRDFGETDAQVRLKVEAAFRGRLEPIVCVGESAEVRDAGGTMARIESQLRASLPESLGEQRINVAYEPVWAIGAGKTPSLEEIAEAHEGLRRVLAHVIGDQAQATPILYGGSVTAENASAVLAVSGVDGVLVGSASLEAADFLPIVWAAEAASEPDGGFESWLRG